MGIMWAGIGAFMLQDHYFTRPDSQGNAQMHPITRWILYYRQTEDERIENIRKLMMDAREEGELRLVRLVGSYY